MSAELGFISLMAELGFISAQTSVMRVEAWWKVIDLVRQFDGLGWDNGWSEDVVMQGNRNARRYIDDDLRAHVIPFLHS